MLIPCSFSWDSIRVLISLRGAMGGETGIEMALVGDVRLRLAVRTEEATGFLIVAAIRRREDVQVGSDKYMEIQTEFHPRVTQRLFLVANFEFPFRHCETLTSWGGIESKGEEEEENELPLSSSSAKYGYTVCP